jgi:hypothetical protein
MTAWWTKGSGCGLRRAGKTSHYTVGNCIEMINPLHMNSHSFGNNCNQYILTPSVSSGSLLESSVFLLESSSKLLSASLESFVVRMDTSESHSEMFL